MGAIIDGVELLPQDACRFVAQERGKTLGHEEPSKAAFTRTGPNGCIRGGAMGLPRGASGGARHLFDRDVERLLLDIARVVADGEREGGAFWRRDADAMRVGRPNRIWLRLEFYRFGVGYAIAELHALSLVDAAGARIETLYGKVLAAEPFQGDAVVFQLFPGALFARSAVNRLVVLPAGKQGPNQKEATH